MSSHDVRWVATYSMTRNMPKNSADVPMSVSKTRMSRLAPQAMSTGPRSRARGRSMPRNRRPASESTSRLATR